MKLLLASVVWDFSVDILREYCEANDIEFRKINPYKERIPYGYKPDVIFNAGCVWHWKGAIINSGTAVEKCINKIATFQAMKKAGVPIPQWVDRYSKIPKKWEEIVYRKTAEGRKNDGLMFFRKGDTIPKDGALYVEGFSWPFEYRIVVFKGKVVGRYYKKVVGDTWELMIQPKKGFQEMDKHAVKAAKALGIDYVGFDVLAKNKKQYVFLEANSAASLREEVALKIMQHLINL